MSRYCKACNEDHLLEEFLLEETKHKLANGNIKIYPSYRCKKHMNNRQNEHNRKNKDIVSKKRKIHREKNKETIEIKEKKYREQNKEKLTSDHKIYYEKNRERLQNYDKIRHKNNSKEVNILRRENRHTRDGMIKSLVQRKKGYNKKLGHDCDIDIEYIELLINNQDSKCIYCNHKLDIVAGNRNFDQLSVDRINSNKLYFKDNIHLTCVFCNYGKNDSDDLIYKQFICALRGQKYNFEYTEHKYLIRQLVSACKKVDKKKYPVENTITIEQVKELLIKQNNKCAISGIEFINADINHYPFKMSLDRIDNSLGHTYENTQLVCMAINLAKSDKSNDDAIKYVNEIMQSPHIPIL